MSDGTNPEESQYQRNPDGSVTTSFDIDGDGAEETVTARAAATKDGALAVEMDVDGDGNPDVVAVDENRDGQFTLDELRAPE